MLHGKSDRHRRSVRCADSSSARFAASGQRRIALCMLCCVMIETLTVRHVPVLVWNASASVPIGLYGVLHARPVAPGDMVIARVPLAWRTLAASRRYIPADVPLVKHVAATEGARVCATGSTISIDGSLAARRLARDPHDRILPWWQGCVVLRGGDVFLLTPSPTSFDGRYFGPTRQKDIVGKAVPLWLR